MLPAFYPCIDEAFGMENVENVSTNIHWHIQIIINKNFFKDLFISLTEIETASERGNTSRESGRGRSRLPAEEPDVGLDPRTPGSRPEPKVDATQALLPNCL